VVTLKLADKQIYFIAPGNLLFYLVPAAVSGNIEPRSNFIDASAGLNSMLEKLPRQMDFPRPGSGYSKLFAPSNKER
jgi:hypothetical protein